MAEHYRPDPTIPNLICIGVPNIHSLEKVLKKLKENQIPHYKWIEPDNNLGFTSIATIPLSSEEKSVLHNYRLWNEANNTIPAELSSGHKPIDGLEGHVLTREPNFGVSNV